MQYLIYDCEIIKCIPGKNGERVDGYEYCSGWTAFESMGISVIGYQWSGLGKPSYCLNALEFFRQVYAAKSFCLVGFNSRNFDDKLMAANGAGVLTGYDILEEIRVAAGFGPTYDTVPKGFSYSLDAIARMNGMAKTGNGALAPQLWQQGRHKQVIDYCLNDVRITKAILELGLAGELKDPNTGEKLQLRTFNE